MSIKGPFEWIPLTVYAIFRNKRRSFAMISGIVLGVMILSGIFIYTSVLDRQNFETVVESASYEVRFDVLDNETRDNLNELKSMIVEDPRATDATIIAREPGDYLPSVEFNLDGEDTSVETPDNVQVNMANIIPLFVDSTFGDSVIGQRVGADMEGNFVLTGGNKTVLPRSLAVSMRLSVGDVLPMVNISYTKILDFPNVEVSEGYLTNVEIVGIYDDATSDAGLFGSLFSISELYFATLTLQNYLKPINDAILKDAGMFLAVKINEDEFSISDPEGMVEEISLFINKISKDAEASGIEAVGNNLISFLLLPYTITSIFVTIFDILLALPVAILSIYLLFFGLQMSLEERRREIAIKKVQGADTRQIYGELRNESIILFIFGFVLGYIGGVFGAWLISSAIGFMRLDIGTFDDFLDFFIFDTTAIIISVIVVGGILTLQTIRQGRKFIEQEVATSVQQFEKKKEGFFKRNKLDMVLLFIGVLNLILSLLSNEFDVDLNLNTFLSILINGLGPFFLWIGGAMYGARVAKFVPLKTEGIFLNFKPLKDVSRIIRSGLRRRGEIDRLAVIIVLTLSIATLAAAQGHTDQLHTIRTTEWEIGADYQVNFGSETNHSSYFEDIDGIDDVLAIGTSSSIRISSSNYRVTGFDVDKEYQAMVDGDPIGLWHDDAFDNLSPEEGLKLLSEDHNGVFMASNAAWILDVVVGDTVNLKIIVGDALVEETRTATIADVTILGFYDHIPGGIIGPSIISSDTLVQKIRATADNTTVDAYVNMELNASRYLIKTTAGEDIIGSEIDAFHSDFSQLDGFRGSLSMYEELDRLSNQKGAFGIPGLLSLDFLVAISAALISTFAFSAIIMERRSKEFAVLRAIGARKTQIYKLALGENFLMIGAAVIWGSIIGVGITYQFNGVFEVFGVFLGSGPLDRIVTFPWLTVTLIGIATTLGMLIATMISVRSAANQDLSSATRVV